MSTIAPNWSDDDTKILMDCWAAGYSGSQIARIVGRSRAGVLGKLFRLRAELGTDVIASKTPAQEIAE